MIRRPFLFTACGCTAAVIVSHYGGLAAAGVAAIAAFAVLLLRKDGCGDGRRRQIAVLLLVSYCLGTISFWYADLGLAGEAARLTGSGFCGEITDCEKKTGNTGEQYLQLTLKSDQGKIIAKCFASCRCEGEAAEGCVAKVTGELRDPDGRRNPGCFDYALYLNTLGVTKTMTCSSLEVQHVRPFTQAPLAFIRYEVCKSREAFIERLGTDTGEQTAAIMRAVMFGDKGSLGEDVLETFQKNGTAHILAVSGLHIGIIYGFILRLWRWRRRWLFFGFNGVFFLLYATAAGFSPSVTRAVMMVLIHTAAVILGKRYDLANAALLIITCTMLHNPYMLFNTGFQMSFIAVLSMVLVLPYIKRFYSGIFLAGAAVQVGLFPFILYHFNYCSLLTVILNVPVVALAGLIVPAGLVSMATGGLPASLYVSKAVKILCIMLQKLNEAVQIDGITTFQLPSPPLWTLAAYYLLLLMFATEEGRLCLIRAKDKGRYVLRMMLVVAALSIGFYAFASDGFENCDIVFVDVGQGDCVCVRTEGGLLGREHCYLFDGGGSENYSVGKSILREYLLKSGISRIDGAFVTHLHTDHYKGICELAQEGMVKRLFVYEVNRLKQEQIMEDTGLEPSQIVYLGAGDRTELNSRSIISLLNQNSVYMGVLYPGRRTDAEYEQMIEQETDENLMSLVFKVTFSGRKGDTSALITGDLGEEGEAELLETYGTTPGMGTSSELQSDILKVGHHGSRTSSTEGFLEAVHPAFAVIQVGKNNMYGHPTPEAIQRLTDAGAAIYRSDLDGAIGIEIRDGRINAIRTMHMRDFSL